MLWNWNHRFFGRKLRGVYFEVRILFLPKFAIGCPSSSFASSGNGILKKILRRTSWETSTLPLSDPLSPSCTSPVRDLSPNDSPPASLFFSFKPCPLWNRSIMERRLLRPLCPPTLCVAHLIRLIGVETLLPFWSGCIAIVGVACGRQMLWPHFVGQLPGFPTAVDYQKTIRY